MPGYIIVDVKTRKAVAVCVGVGLVTFGLGIVIGYFSRSARTVAASESYNDCSMERAVQTACQMSALLSDSEALRVNRYMKDYQEKACLRKDESCFDHELPRNYIAYHLNGKAVQLDGRLDDDAWQEVPWTETFVDIRSERYGNPRLETKAKVRWDDERLYIGAYLQETDLWGTITTEDSKVHQDNDFEVLMDVDGSLHNYKQVQMNVLGTHHDLMHYVSPADDGDRTHAWSADIQKAVFADGTINHPGDTDKYWSIEMSFSFEALANETRRNSTSVNDGEVWFMIFGRSEYALTVTEDNKYVTTPGLPADWWSWRHIGAVNLMLQNRWGLVQFRRNMADTKFLFREYHIYRALFDMFEALRVYLAINGKNGVYTDRVEELNVPPYLLSNLCVEIPEVKLTNKRKGFEVIVRSKVIQHAPGHIRQDRLVWFE